MKKEIIRNSQRQRNPKEAGSQMAGGPIRTAKHPFGGGGKDWRRRPKYGSGEEARGEGKEEMMEVD